MRHYRKCEEATKKAKHLGAEQVVLVPYKTANNPKVKSDILTIIDQANEPVPDKEKIENEEELTVTPDDIDPEDLRIWTAQRVVAHILNTFKEEMTPRTYQNYDGWVDEVREVRKLIFPALDDCIEKFINRYKEYPVELDEDQKAHWKSILENDEKKLKESILRQKEKGTFKKSKPKKRWDKDHVPTVKEYREMLFRLFPEEETNKRASENAGDPLDTRTFELMKMNQKAAFERMRSQTIKLFPWESL